VKIIEQNRGCNENHYDIHHREGKLEFVEWFVKKCKELNPSTNEIDFLAVANHIGVTKKTVVAWYTGMSEPSSKSVDKIAAKFGTEAYDLLHYLGPGEKDYIYTFDPLSRAALLEYRKRMKERNILPGDPEGLELLKSTLKEFGVDLN